MWNLSSGSISFGRLSIHYQLGAHDRSRSREHAAPRPASDLTPKQDPRRERECSASRREKKELLTHAWGAVEGSVVGTMALEAKKKGLPMGPISSEARGRPLTPTMSAPALIPSGAVFTW